MKIVVLTDTLHVGGAETFIVRLCNALASKHNVYLINIHPQLSNSGLIGKIDPKVTLINFNSRYRRGFLKLDSFFRVFRVDSACFERAAVDFLSDQFDHILPDVIHSHLFPADLYSVKALEKSGISCNHVLTNHGDYLLYDKAPPELYLNYDTNLKYVLKRVRHIVNISDEQVSYFKRLKEKESYFFKLHKIVNGYYTANRCLITKADLGIEEDAFVYGMVARGIKEKGWHEAIKAFLKSKTERAYLVLIGVGKEIDRLRKLYHNNDTIKFLGLIDNPVDYIRLFDVGLLPSYYKAESLPTVIIEYLYCQKPVIASDVGEIKRMITTRQGSAGLLLDVSSSGVSEDQLAGHMISLYKEKELYKQLQQETIVAFQKFDMKYCVSEYEKVYTDY